MRAISIVLLLLCTPLTLAQSVFPDAGRVVLSLETEPPNLDSTLSSDTTSYQILTMINEGLVRTGRRGEIIPGVAESWDQAPKEITFHLRADAKWSNGDPVTAHDFVYAARRLVDPATGAAGSAFLIETIANAEAIMKGELPPEAIAVAALDDRTLHVELSRPAPYALYLFAYTSLFPLNQAFVEAQGNRYAADAENLLSNGPFVVEKWQHSANLELRKNEQYWDADAIRLNEIDFSYITSDVRALFNLFKTDEIAALEIDRQVMRDAAQTDHRIQKVPQNCLMYIDLNQSEGRPLSNLKLRRAIRLAVDRDRFVNNILALPGIVPLDSIYTETTRTSRRRFIQEYPVPEIRFDVEEARRLVTEAKQEMGVDEIPPIVLITREQREQQAEFIQSQLNGALGLDVRVDIQTFKQYLAKMDNRDFDMTSSGFCGGSFSDPIVYAGMFTTDSQFNRNGFSSTRYDELIAITHSTADQAIRARAFDEAQQILFEEAVVIPTHQLSVIYLQHPRLHGIQRYPDPYFAGGYIR